MKHEIKMDMDLLKIFTTAILIALVIFAAFLAILDYFTPEPTITEHTVETVGFISKDGFGAKQVISVDTGDAVIAIDRVDTDIIKITGETYQLVVRDYHESIRHINDSPNVLYVPEEHAYAISQSYTQTFGETLEFKTED